MNTEKCIILGIVALLVAYFIYDVTKAEAFPPPYDPFLPQYELSPVVPEIQRRGMQAPYRVENTSGMLPRWAQQVSNALDSASPNSQSSGRILAQWINYYRDDANPVSIHRADSTAAFESFCGSWAIGCAQWYTLPGVNRYRAAAMVAWGDDSVAAVVRHEDAHTTFNACDQYLHGDPTGDIADADLACRYSGSSSTCTGNPDSIMDCGQAARFLQPYDVNVFLLRYGIQQPAPPSCDGPTDPSWGGTWNDCTKRWVHPDGRSFDPATGFWYFNGVLTFDYCDTRWGGRHTAIGAWVHVGTRLFFDQHLVWLEAPPC
jgi:hypothetical protein